MRTVKKNRGFTLLEVLVALVIIGVALAAAMRGAMSLTSTAEYTRQKLLAVLTAENRLLELRLGRERLEPEDDDVRSLLTTFGQMERDLTQVTNPVFLGLTTSPLNIGVADGGEVIELARVASPVADRATEVQTVFYRVVDGSLMRQATPPLPAFDRADGERFETARLLGNVQSMTVRVWQVPTGWESPFRPDGSSAPPPGVLAAPGVEVTLLRTDGKKFRRVFLVGA